MQEKVIPTSQRPGDTVAGVCVADRDGPSSARILGQRRRRVLQIRRLIAAGRARVPLHLAVVSPVSDQPLPADRPAQCLQQRHHRHGRQHRHAARRSRPFRDAAGFRISQRRAVRHHDNRESSRLAVRRRGVRRRLRGLARFGAERPQRSDHQRAHHPLGKEKSAVGNGRRRSLP